MAKIGLVGPSYVMKSLPLDAQRTINLFPVADESGKETAALYMTPGLLHLATIGNGPCRKCFSSSNGRAFVVSGSGVYEYFEDNSYILRGDLDQSFGNVSMAESDLQLAICDGTSLFMFTYATNSFQKVTGTGLPASVGYVESIDGYFVVTENNSGRFFISGILDGLSFYALDFATAESNPDQLLAIANVTGQLYLLGSRGFEVWTNTGAEAFPFNRVNGAIGTSGVMAPHTVCINDGVLLWVGQDKYGNGNVFLMQGYRPQRISTEAIELVLNYVPNPSEMKAYMYQSEGHTFYVITGGGLETSLVFDLTTKLWHERAFLNEDGDFEQHLAYDLMYAFDKHICVDRRNGNIYEMSMSAYDDAGLPIARERIFTHLSDENKYIRYNKLEIGVEAGVGVQDEASDGYNPQISLKLSKDGARTWSDWQNVDIGKAGEFRKRAIFRRLGVAYQMTFRIRISAPVKVMITGAYLE